MKMFVTALFSLVILIVCVALMSIRVILKKGGTFPNTHISSNIALKNKGIHCMLTQDRMAVKKKNIFEHIDINNIH
jgi:signal-transduction protein with cAMP-binding, CBS, and nucleotidyltransferase domain